MVLENLYLKIIISKQALLKLLFIERKKKISSSEYIFPLRILNTSRQEFMLYKKRLYLGFIFDSANILLNLAGYKNDKIQHASILYLKKGSRQIRELANLIANFLTATFQKINLDPLFYKALDDKCAGEKSKGNFQFNVNGSKDALPLVER